MHGYVKAEKHAKWMVSHYGDVLPDLVVAWAEGVIAYCREQHDAALSDQRAIYRKAKANAFIRQLEHVSSAVGGIGSRSRADSNG